MSAIGFIIDPIEKLDQRKDSSLLLMNAAQRAGREVFWATAQSIHYHDGQVYGQFHAYQKKQTSILRSLNSFSDIMLREEPPLDIDYINLTYVYERAENVRFINTPQGLRSASEKLCPLWFPEFIPPQLISRRIQKILEFLEIHGSIVLKPIGLFGSSGVSKMQSTDHNREMLLKTMTKNESTLVVCQQFLPGVMNGDRRVFIVQGKVLGCFDSIPAPNDFRGNHGFGAGFAKATLTDREQFICESIGPRLLQEGILFAGVDMIQDYITEINVSCVGGIWNMNTLYGGHFEDIIFKTLFP